MTNQNVTLDNARATRLCLLIALQDAANEQFMGIQGIDFPAHVL